MNDRIRITVWNEFRHEQNNAKIKELYPKGMHRVIADHLAGLGEFDVRTATLDQPDHGLSPEVLEQTDVLTWWGHMAHGEVKDEIVEKVHQRVLSGMGLIVLHSGHFAKIFRKLLGTNCSLRWREMGEKERIWNLAPGHEITRGVPEHFELPHSEMYGERFDIPDPDKLIFVSWYAGGEVFRSGCCWERGHGRIFYFSPGHETYPIYYDKNVLRVIENAARWARPRIWGETLKCPNNKVPMEKI